MPVPPKDPAQRRRRNVAGGKVLLPAGGRKGRAPAWPLLVGQPTVWKDLWKLPQAAAWEQMSMQRVVARYALLLTDAELPAASTPLLVEVRQLEDRLGLNPKAMRSLLWEVAADEVAEQRAKQPVATPAESARSRLKVV